MECGVQDSEALMAFFLQRLTAAQRQGLRAGRPDDATRCSLAQLLALTVLAAPEEGARSLAAPVGEDVCERASARVDTRPHAPTSGRLSVMLEQLVAVLHTPAAAAAVPPANAAVGATEACRWSGRWRGFSAASGAALRLIGDKLAGFSGPGVQEDRAELQALAYDIAQLVTAQEEGGGGGGERAGPYAQGAARKIKTLFGKRVARAWLVRLLELYQEKYRRNPAPDERRAFFRHADSLILTTRGVRPGAVSAFSRVRSLSDAEVPPLTLHLALSMYRLMADGAAAEEDPPAAAMLGDLRRGAWAFLATLRWWQELEAEPHASRTSRALQREVAERLRQEDAAAAAADAPGAARLTEDGRRARVELRKLAVEIAVQMLAGLIFTKPEVLLDQEDVEAIIQRLNQTVWAEVGGLRWTIHTKTLKKLGKAVFKDLLKTWGSAEAVLVLLRLEGSPVENSVSGFFRRRLLAPPHERNAVFAFF